MADTQHTPHLAVGVLFDRMSWAELRAYVHLCRDIPDAEPVALNYDRDSYELVGLEEYVPASAVMPNGA